MTAQIDGHVFKLQNHVIAATASCTAGATDLGVQTKGRCRLRTFCANRPLFRRWMRVHPRLLHSLKCECVSLLPQAKIRCQC